MEFVFEELLDLAYLVGFTKGYIAALVVFVVVLGVELRKLRKK